ncbi:hypothetical protein P5008_07890 [Helcococcus ovis]|uniref:hypothetical protein n=1 Tax=Helcococcus ovis TaxID=72026 RepID=UPI00391717D8
MKYKILSIIFLVFLMVGCMPQNKPKKEVKKIDFSKAMTFDDSKVSKDFKSIVDADFAKDKEYIIPKKDEKLYSLKVSKDAKVSHEEGDSNIAVTFKHSQNEYVVTIIPVAEEFEPNAFYSMYSEFGGSQLYKMDGLDLLMYSSETREMVGEFKAKNNGYYVITIKSNFNVDENGYIMKKIIENLDK